jgi:hypothetical protein
VVVNSTLTDTGRIAVGLIMLVAAFVLGLLGPLLVIAIPLAVVAGMLAARWPVLAIIPVLVALLVLSGDDPSQRDDEADIARFWFLVVGATLELAVFAGIAVGRARLSRQKGGP